MQSLLYGLFGESPWNSESVQIPYKIINDSLWAKLTCFPYNNIYIICYHYKTLRPGTGKFISVLLMAKSSEPAISACNIRQLMTYPHLVQLLKIGCGSLNDNTLYSHWLGSVMTSTRCVACVYSNKSVFITVKPFKYSHTVISSHFYKKHW